MNELAHAARRRTEAEMPTDLLAGLLMEQARVQSCTTDPSEKLPPKIYGVMAATTLLTFATLMTGYQILFTHHLFA